VLNNDLRHPVPLAQELATLDHVSRGRLEVGIGAGHSFTEYAAMGQAFDPPALRKERLGESVEILRALLDGQTVSRTGVHYQLDNVATPPPQQEHVPLLVGVNGRAALAHAVRHADIVAPTMLGHTREDGHRTTSAGRRRGSTTPSSGCKRPRANGGTHSSCTHWCRRWS
jgi:alkanesulfonate monooxygenase SsuD/methylene tetrahydromethanopterin reductase-like flavin-dependent oxidoreductase (luciferase family)